MYNQPNMNNMYNGAMNMYGMGACQNISNCNCNSGCYNPYPPYPPYPPRPSNFECYKCCNAYREFGIYTTQVAEALDAQAKIGQEVDNKLQAIIKELETQRKYKIEQLPKVEAQMIETKKKYQDCIIECEKHHVEPCGCNCYCEPCHNAVEGYCPQCDELRNEYELLVTNFDMLQAEIGELDIQIAGLKGYTDERQKRALLQQVESDSFRVDAKAYEKKYEECKLACKMNSCNDCM